MNDLYLVVAFVAGSAVLIAAFSVLCAPRRTADLLQRLIDRLNPQDDEPAGTSP